MLTDYKLVTVVQFATSTHAVARFYEGEVNTLDERDENGSLQPVTRYRRAKMLRKLS